MQSFFLLLALGGAFGLSLVLCGLALRLAPQFRSGERKEGVFRSDQSLGNGSATGKGRRAPSSELPLVGSRGMVPAMLIAGGATGWFMHFNEQQWTMLAILGAGLIGFWLVGFIDDWQKVRRGYGIRELTKFIGVAIVSIGFAVAFLLLVDKTNTPYLPYDDIPGLGTLFQNVQYTWAIFYVLLVLCVASLTSLSVDFSDGLDGLAGGLTFPSALAFAIIILDQDIPAYYPLAIAALALAGSSLGFLPWNWPSSWKGRGSTTPRRARLIMGDSGSLALGGLLAMVALADHQEPLLPLIGGIFVLEGLSSVYQSRLLVKFFRRFLRVERFQTAGDTWFPHTEYPLPFLATPMHHHFDLLGWDRRRLVYGAWLIAALMATLTVASALAPITWERYLARVLVVVIGIILWQSGHHTRGYFIGSVPSPQGQKLALFYGYPYRIFGRPLYSMVEQVEISVSAISLPAEQNTLWVRTNVFDARAALGFYCYRAGFPMLAREQWERIPQPNLAVRPRIQELLEELRRRMAVAAGDESYGTIETAMGAEPSPADTFPSSHSLLNTKLTADLEHGALPFKSADTMPASRPDDGDANSAALHHIAHPDNSEG